MCGGFKTPFPLSSSSCLPNLAFFKFAIVQEKNIFEGNFSRCASVLNETEGKNRGETNEYMIRVALRFHSNIKRAQRSLELLGWK